MERPFDTLKINRLRVLCFMRYLLHGKRSESYRFLKLSLCLALMFVVLILKVGINEHTAQAASMLQIIEGDALQYFKGTTNPPRGWTSIDFDDSRWLSGITGLGYGGSNRTYLSDMQGHYSTIYSRRQFHVNNIYAVTGISLSIACDGPFIAYLNGIEIIRNASVSKSAPDKPATPLAEQLDVSGFIHELLPGKNVLSVECNNDDINSIDFSFIPLFEIFEKQGGQAQ